MHRRFPRSNGVLAVVASLCRGGRLAILSAVSVSASASHRRRLRLVHAHPALAGRRRAPHSGPDRDSASDRPPLSYRFRGQLQVAQAMRTEFAHVGRDVRPMLIFLGRSTWDRVSRVIDVPDRTRTTRCQVEAQCSQARARRSRSPALRCSQPRPLRASPRLLCMPSAQVPVRGPAYVSTLARTRACPARICVAGMRRASSDRRSSARRQAFVNTVCKVGCA